MRIGETEKKIFAAVKLSEDTKAGSITTKIMAEKILEALETVEEFQKAREILDYANAVSIDGDIVTDNEAWDSDVMAVVNTGGSEGIYIDWYLHNRKKHEYICLGTLKTLDEGFSGYRIMGEISGMLVMATEAFIYENDKFFAEEEN